MRSFPRAVAALLGSAALAFGVLTAPAPADARDGVEPVLSNLNLTYPAIHAVGVKGTHLPRTTHLLLTVQADALLRVRLKDTNPYGISRAFNVDITAGQNAVPITARVDGTKMPPGRYKVVVKAHNSAGSSDRFRLNLKIVGKNG
jgi:hypothetical protein